MPRLVVGDRAVSYEDYGAGPVALLVHGSPGNGKAWQRVGDRLAANHRVVTPDLPGHGATRPQPVGTGPDVGYAAALIESLIDAVGPPTVLAGYSYGGVVALAVALRARTPLGALALLEPVAVSALGLTGDEALHARTRTVFERYIAEVEGRRANPRRDDGRLLVRAGRLRAHARPPASVHGAGGGDQRSRRAERTG